MKANRIIFSLCFIIAAACKSNETLIHLNNEAKIDFDSVNVSINNYKMNLGKVEDKKEIKRAIPGNTIPVGKDVTVNVQAFVKDSLQMTGTIFLMDSGFIPHQFKMKITDSLTIVNEEIE